MNVCGVEEELKAVLFVPVGGSGLGSWAAMKKPPLRNSYWSMHSITVIGNLSLGWKSCASAALPIDPLSYSGALLPGSPFVRVTY